MYANTLKYHSFASIGPGLLNALPRFIKESSTLDSFKAVLNDFLMTLPDTPLLQVTLQLTSRTYQSNQNNHQALQQCKKCQVDWDQRLLSCLHIKEYCLLKVLF